MILPARRPSLQRTGTLCGGDSLPILRDYLRDETIDLVYLDPPFNADASYNAAFKGKHGAVASQVC